MVPARLNLLLKTLLHSSMNACRVKWRLPEVTLSCLYPLIVDSRGSDNLIIWLVESRNGCQGEVAVTWIW